MLKALKFFTSYKIEVFLFLIALGAQLIIFFMTRSYGDGGFLWSSDAEGYFAIIKNFFVYHGFYLDYAFGPQSFRTPAYPLFAVLMFWLVPRLDFIILVQNILAAGVIVLLYRFGKKFIDKKAAILGTVLFIFESQRLQNTNQLMTETLFFLFFIPMLSLVLDNLKSKLNLKRTVFSGILLGLATLVRPTPYFLIISLPLVMIFFGILRKDFKKYAVQAVLFFVFSFSVIVPWMARNYGLFGKFSIGSGLGAYMYNINGLRFLEYKYGEEARAAGTERAINDLNYTGRTPEGTWDDWLDNGIFEFQYEPYLFREGFKIILSDPASFARLYVRRMITFFLDSSASRSYKAILSDLNLPDKIFYPTLYWGGRFWWLFVWVIILLGLLRHRRASNAWFYIATFGLAFYFSASLAMNSDAPRMRLAITPLILLLFADQLLQFKKRFYAK